jgi:hypothetical protein
VWQYLPQALEALRDPEQGRHDRSAAIQRRQGEGLGTDDEVQVAQPYSLRAPPIASPIVNRWPWCPA